MRNPSSWVETILFTCLLFMLCIPAAAQNEAAPPTAILKDTLTVETYNNEFVVEGQPPKWTPLISFETNGELPSGARLWAEVSLPGKPKWLTGDCAQDETRTNGWLCIGRNDKEGVRIVAPMDFRIHFANELLGENRVLFTGKAKIAKTPPRFKDPNSFEYYVDDDWRIPIAYIWKGQRTLNVQMIFRGKPGEVSLHLFYQGKELATGENCGVADFDPKAYVWWPVSCELFSGNNEVTELKPGEYEFRVLQEKRLTRKATFKVDDQGSFDNGIASKNQLGRDKVVIPVTVLVDHVPWDKLAWQAGAFYGNPLVGFAP